MKGGKRHITEGVELPNKVVIRTLGKKETCKYLGILEADTIKKQEMKKIKKECLRRARIFMRQNSIAGTLSKE